MNKPKEMQIHTYIRMMQLCSILDCRRGTFNTFLLIFPVQYACQVYSVNAEIGYGSLLKDVNLVIQKLYIVN